MKIILICLTCSILLSSCMPKPDKAFSLIDEFLQLRLQKDYTRMYALFHPMFVKNNPYESFFYQEELYAKKFGPMVKYNVKRSSWRKNISCGPSSGKMLAVITDIMYKKGHTEETFTIIKRNGNWKIFDYYLRPIHIDY